MRKSKRSKSFGKSNAKRWLKNAPKEMSKIKNTMRKNVSSKKKFKKNGRRSKSRNLRFIRIKLK